MALRSIQLTVGNMPVGVATTWSYPKSDGHVYSIPTYNLNVIGRRASTGFAESHDFVVIRFGVNRKTTSSAPTIVGLSAGQSYTIKRWIPRYKVHSFPSTEDGAWQVHGDFLIHDGPDDPRRELYATAGCIEICGGPQDFVKFNDLMIALSGSTKRTRGEQLAEIGASGAMRITYLAATPPALTRVR